MSADPYCYDNTDVLKNKFNIRDPDKLSEFELGASYTRYTSPVALTLSPGGICQIHYHLFQDVYPWAGEIRSVEISKPGAPFCRPQFIEQELKKLTATMNTDTDLKSADPRKFATSAGKHIIELNAIHPFREGNGRTNRLILELLAEHAGHKLSIPRSAQARWMSASKIGLNYGKSDAMADLIYDHIDKGREDQKNTGR